MTQREEIEALREEIAALRVRLGQLEGQPAVHHDHHYPSVAPTPQPPFLPSVAPYPFTSPNICQTHTTGRPATGGVYS